jgi:hypothetical protein
MKGWTYLVVDSGWVKTFIFLWLPRSLGDTRKFAAVCHLAEADTADAELLVDSMWATTTLATGVPTNLELRLASSFNLERCLCH